VSALSLPFMQTALLCGLLAGNALALLGALVVPRGVSFSGLAVSQLAALGTVLGAVLGLHAGGHGAALACVLFGLLVFQRLSRNSKMPSDPWVASLYLLAASAAVLLLSKAPHGEAHTMTLFFGNVLGLGRAEVIESAVLGVVTLAAVALFRHRWLWVFSDPLGAQVGGVSVTKWNGLFFVLFAAAMTTGIHIFGVLLAFTFLVLPAAVALGFAGRMRTFFLWVPVVTTTAIFAGIVLSFELDFPTGPFVTALLAAATIVGGLVRSLKND